MPAQKNVNVKLTGPWAQTAKALGVAPKKIMSAYRKAARPLLGELRDNIRKGYKKASPGLAASTLLARKLTGRGGSKPLFVSGDLRNSVSLKRAGSGYFVGIMRTAGGKSGFPLANLGQIHEEGRTFAVPATKRSKHFLAKLYGVPAIANSTVDFFIVTIPARPVFAPAFKAWDPKKFADEVAKKMQADLFGIGVA